MDFTPIHLNVNSHPQGLKRIRALMTDVTRQMHITGKEAASITLAVDEACSNIIRHGYKNDTSQQIDLTVYTDRGNLVIQIEDIGTHFDITQAVPRDPEEIQPGGLGVFIINQVMDSLEYAKTPDGRNQTRLIKKLT